MEYPRLERLTTAECRQLLPTAAVGRLALATPTFPTIEAVSFAVVEGEIIVAARPGTAADAIPEGTRATFEAEVLDHHLHSGWSVTVTGPVEDLDSDVASLVASHLSPWATGPHDRLLLVRSTQITGQRVVAGPPTPSITLAPAPDSSPEAPSLRRRVLSATEGLARLRDGGQQVGRLVVTMAGDPLVFPLNFTLDDDAVVFRTRAGTKLSGITRSMATFEVDQIDASGQGWSVTVKGLAQEVIDADPPALRERIAALSPDTWPGGDRPHVVRVVPYSVEGESWTAVEAAVAADAGQATV